MYTLNSCSEKGIGAYTISVQCTLTNERRDQLATDKTDDRLVYEVPEAGAKLGLPRSGSYAAVKRGEIPSIRIGRLIKVPKAAFDEMLRAKTGAP
jgi:excisionase family DNA binding protein